MHRHESGLLDDHVRALGPRLRLALTATASRNRSLDARHLLARAALGDNGTLDQLIAAARAGDRRWLRRMRRRVRPALVAAVAQAVALQDQLPTDRDDALAMFALIRRALDVRGLSPAQQALHAQLVLNFEGPEQARRLLRRYRRIPAPARANLEADLLNPFVADRPAAPWRAAFHALLPAPGPEVADGAEVPFDRLTAAAPERVEGPHRISVVVTAYRPDRGLITAVRSILAQSWANTEVIIVDDASPPEFEPVLAEAAGLGERIRLIRMPANGGTYAARNAGLAAAGGEFAAFQDSDDWSHPRRLELQVRPLLEDRKLVATTSDGLAVTDQLLLTRPGVRSGRFNPSSLLFRRSRVLREAGEFDPVRKAADSEFIGRIQAVFGARRVRHLDTLPLALIRLSANSLSRSEIKAHWMHPARTAYMSAYQRRHQLIAEGSAPAKVPGRAFPAPDHLLGVRRDRAYDVVMAADWRFLESAQRTAVDELRALTAAGLRVAVLQLESYRAAYLRRHPLCAPVQDMINEGVLDRVALAETVHAGLLIVRQAAVVQFTAGEESHLRADRAVLVADRAPVRADGTDRRYEPATCAAAVRRLFGADPVWAPQDPGVRAALRNQAGPGPAWPTALAAPGGSTALAVPGGSTVLAVPGGSTVLGAPDWPTALTAPGGSTVLGAPDWPTALPGPGGSTVLAASDGSTVLAVPGGSTALSASDGSTVLAVPGGSTALPAPEGPTPLAAPGGSTVLAEPDWPTALTPPGGSAVLAEPDWPTALAAPGWVAERTGAASGPPVVGTDLCDAANWPPDAADSLAVCRRLPDADVRVRLPDRPRGECAVGLGRGWLGFEVADLAPGPFLHQLDFYLHFPPREAAEWYSRPALEAAAMGCVVVMPERYAGFYGDAAVYCSRSEVAPLIARYRADPALFAEQSRRARQVVAAAHDPARLVERIMAGSAVTAAATPALPMV